jgi:uncharacterized protein
MKPEIVNAIKLLLNNRVPDLSNLNVQWFGGEPLLAYNIILDIMNHIKILKSTVNPDLNIIGTMTTNGYMLNQKTLKRLTEIGIKDYQITLDGNREEHDKLRIKSGIEGTFDNIWKNLISAHQSNIDFLITIRLHVNGNNFESIKDLLSIISNEIGDDKRFNIFIRFLSRLGSANDNNLSITEDYSKINLLKKFAIDKGLILSNLDIYKDKYLCYAANPTSYIIRANGELSKCTVALYNDNNIIGKINNDGTLELKQEKIYAWIRGIFSGNMNELSCPLIGLSNYIKIVKNKDTYEPEKSM